MSHPGCPYATLSTPTIPGWECVAVLGPGVYVEVCGEGGGHGGGWGGGGFGGVTLMD